MNKPEEFHLDLGDDEEVQVWKTASGVIQLAVHDRFDGTSVSLTTEQARKIVDALRVEVEGGEHPAENRRPMNCC